MASFNSILDQAKVISRRPTASLTSFPPYYSIGSQSHLSLGDISSFEELSGVCSPDKGQNGAVHRVQSSAAASYLLVLLRRFSVSIMGHEI